MLNEEVMGNSSLKPFMYSAFLFLTVCGVSACSTAIPADTRPQQELSFTQITPYHVQAARIDIESTYVPGSDPKDVASDFPVAPDVAVRRYAENRLQVAGTSGGLKFIIEDARIHYNQIEQENKIVNWMGAGKQDQYELFMRLNIYYTNDVGLQEGRQGTFNFNRTLTMPSSVSMAEREERQLMFMEQLMKDVDVAVTKALTEKFSMLDDNSVPLSSLRQETRL